MQTSLDVMKTALRVLTALNQKLNPDPHDVQILREFEGGGNDSDLDVLACEVIQKALKRRAALRSPGN